jgi:hypothetical protein
MLGFYFPSENLYGLPERKNKFNLNVTTKGKEPLRCYSVDKFPHSEWSNIGLYSGIPYVTSHPGFSKPDSSVLWINAAETYVDIAEQ